MGIIRDYKCKCGYKATIFEGVGMMGCNRTMIAQFFPDEAEIFEQLYQNRQISSYVLKNVTVSCMTCKKIESVACFTYKTNSDTKIHIKDKCVDCGNKMNVVNEENITCPKCGLAMNYVDAGVWD